MKMICILLIVVSVVLIGGSAIYQERARTSERRLEFERGTLTTTLHLCCTNELPSGLFRDLVFAKKGWTPTTCADIEMIRREAASLETKTK